MVAKFKVKPPVQNSGSVDPKGTPAKLLVTPIVSPATVAKARGGSANLGSGIGNS
jgi:hypothetical protein